MGSCKANNFDFPPNIGGIKMPEETKTPVATPNPEDVAAQAIEKLKEENKRLLAENDNLNAAKTKYYDKVLNGQESGKKEETHRSAQEIREDLWGKGKKQRTNLENAKLYTELDDACMRENGYSVFLPPINRGDSWNVDEERKAVETRKAFDEMIKVANGSSSVFDQEFARRFPKPIAISPRTRK